LAGTGCVQLTGRLCDHGSHRTAELAVGWTDPRAEPEAIHLLARLGASLVEPDVSRRRPPSPRVSRARPRPDRQGELVAVTVSSGAVAGGDQAVTAELVDLLHLAGWTVLAPWHPTDRGRHRQLDEVLARLVGLLDQRRPLLARWEEGDLTADGLVALGTAVAIHRAGPVPESPGWHRLLDTVLGFLRASNVDRARVPTWLWDRYVAGREQLEPWLPFRSPPLADQARLTDLGEDEVRLVTVSGPEARVVVTYRADRVAALADTDLPGSDWLLAVLAEDDELYDCFTDAAWATPYWEWVHPELEPFLPAPRHLI
jgi:hypothetical protein